MGGPRLFAYGMAVLVATLAVLLAGGVEVLRERGMFLLPLAAVTASSWYGGLGPALASTLVGTALVTTTGWGDPDPLRVGVFVALALTIGLAGERQRRDREERERMRAAAEEAERRFAFLAAASSVLGASLEYDVTLTNVARLAVPFLADWCTVDLLEPGGGVRRVALAHGNPAQAELVRAAKVYPPDPAGAHPRTRVLQTGQPELIPEIFDADLARIAGDGEHLRVMRALGYRSAMIVPLAARGQTLGAITFATTDSGRRYCPGDLALADDLARRAALAIDNARLHRDAQLARSEAEAASQAKDEFLAVLSHELRTPLTSVLLWARLVARGLAPARVAHAAKMIERSTWRQARLVEDLLAASRIITGSLQLDLVPTDLGSLLEAAIETIRPGAERKRLTLTCALEPPGRPVLADARRLEQALGNVLANAVEFTPDGGRIDVSLEPDGDRARIRVHDTGEGIEPGFLPQVFDRFRQGDSTSTRRHGGLGLGLAIVREIVTLHGGTVRAESPGRGHGATFTLELPLATEAQAQTA